MRLDGVDVGHDGEALAEPRAARRDRPRRPRSSRRSIDRLERKRRRLAGLGIAPAAGDDVLDQGVPVACQSSAAHSAAKAASRAFQARKRRPEIGDRWREARHSVRRALGPGAKVLTTACPPWRREASAMVENQPAPLAAAMAAPSEEASTVVERMTARPVHRRGSAHQKSDEAPPPMATKWLIGGRGGRGTVGRSAPARARCLRGGRDRCRRAGVEPERPAMMPRAVESQYGVMQPCQ